MQAGCLESIAVNKMRQRNKDMKVCRVLRAACCVLRVACCVLCVAYCVLRVGCCVCCVLCVVLCCVVLRDLFIYLSKLLY